MRDPTSPYSFLNYLHASTNPSRLVSFISRSTFTPSRIEYADYLAWAAAKVAAELAAASAPGAAGEVAYAEEVVAVEPVRASSGGGDVELLRVVTRDVRTGAARERVTRNLCIGTGGGARLPTSLATAAVAATGRAIHTSHFLHRVPRALDAILAARYSSPSSSSTSSSSTPPSSPTPIRIGVIGGGQSAAETFLAVQHLLAARLADDARAGRPALPRPTVELVIKKGSLHAAQDASFENEAFDPGMSQAVFALDEDARERLLEEALGTNYAVVNPKTIDALYEEMYAQTVAEGIQARSPSALHVDPKFVIRPFTAVEDGRAEGEGGEGAALALTLSNVLTGATREETYDLVICATGYDRSGWRAILFPDGAGAHEGLAGLFEARPASPPEPAGCSAGRNPMEEAVERLGTTHLHASPRTSRERTQSATPSSSSAAASSSATSFGTSSATSSRVTSPSPSSSRSRSKRGSGSGGGKAAVDFSVSVNYRLELPGEVAGAEGGKFRPTVWLQGANEETHGISDSLLSVLSVRSGEVVEGLRREGWFGREE